MNNSMDAFLAACDEGPGICAYLITFCSIVLIFITLPVSLCFAVKVVQEYERVVIFRLGRLLSGGARGPGIFFIVPCVDSYQKVDMRTLTFDVPPQEVSHLHLTHKHSFRCLAWPVSTVALSPHKGRFYTQQSQQVNGS